MLSNYLSLPSDGMRFRGIGHKMSRWPVSLFGIKRQCGICLVSRGSRESFR